MTRSYEETQIMRRLKDLLPSKQAKQGDRVLKAAAELLEKCRRFTDRNYVMVRGLLTRCVLRLFNVHRVALALCIAFDRPDQQLIQLGVLAPEENLENLFVRVQALVQTKKDGKY